MLVHAYITDNNQTTKPIPKNKKIFITFCFRHFIIPTVRRIKIVTGKM